MPTTSSAIPRLYAKAIPRDRQTHRNVEYDERCYVKNTEFDNNIYVCMAVVCRLSRGRSSTGMPRRDIPCASSARCARIEG